MKTQRIRVLSVDVVQVACDRGTVHVSFEVRTPVGDSHGVGDLALGSAEAMTDALFEAARKKASAVMQAFTGSAVEPDKVQVADYRASRDHVLPLLQPLAALAAEGAPSEEARLDLETSGVHLVLEGFDLMGKSREQRADVLRRRARRCLEASDFEQATIMAERLRRLVPDDAEAGDFLEHARARRPISAVE